MATVLSIRHEFTNEYRWPIAFARLSCGHDASVQLVPQQGDCLKCGTRQVIDRQADEPYHKCACGFSGFGNLSSRDPHVEANRATKIGDAVECQQCAREARELAWLRELPREDVHHARFRFGSYYFYRRDTSSPTGVILIGVVTPTPAVEALLAEKRISPLSPTEAR